MSRAAALGTPALLLFSLLSAARAAPATAGPDLPPPARAPAEPSVSSFCAFDECGDAKALSWVERARHAMGTRLRLRIGASDRRGAIRATEAAFRAVAGVEEILSTWRPDTELSALNAAPPGRPTRLSRPLVRLLAEAAAWSERTEGAFDPAVGALVDAWDLRDAGRRPDSVALERALRSSGLDCFSLPDLSEARDEGGPLPATRRCPEAWIDAGAFGKGAALREARRALRASGATAGILDFGGQTLVFGSPPSEVGDGAEAGGAKGAGEAPGAGDAPGTGDAASPEGASRAWPVAVAHPARRAEPVAWLALRDASAATSGASERGPTAEGERIGHILDPRTGRPVDAWGSVTVVHPDPMTADLLSTALFVLGPEAGRDLADRIDVAALFLVEKEGGGIAVRPSRRMGRHLCGTGDAAVRSRPPDRGATGARDSDGAATPFESSREGVSRTEKTEKRITARREGWKTW